MPALMDINIVVTRVHKYPSAVVENSARWRLSDPAARRNRKEFE